MVGGGKKSYNKGLLILLGVLCLAIVGLGVGVGVVFLRNNEEAQKNAALEKVVLDIDDYYSGEVLSSEGSLVFKEYMQDKIDSGEYTPEEVFDYFETVIKNVEGEVKLRYLVYYAELFLETQQDVYGAVDIVKRFELDIKNDNDLKMSYYAVLSDLYEDGGDMENAEYYNKILLEMVPSEVYNLGDGSDENDQL